jgi:hypothetical protein
MDVSGIAESRDLAFLKLNNNLSFTIYPLVESIASTLLLAI